MDAPDFDPRTASEYEIMARARTLPGRRLRTLHSGPGADLPSSAANKGWAGAAIERYFGIAANSDQAPDFEAAGIELKICPLVMDQGAPKRVKERTSVTMIDYMSLDTETWATASVRDKLGKVLFVFYEWRPDVPVGDLIVRAVSLWTPPDELLPHLERDWTAVWTKNHEGRAEEISEGDGRILGAATKGATGAMRPQPHSPVLAKSRAWALKPPFTWSIFTAATEPPEYRTTPPGALDAGAGDESYGLAAKLDPFIGATVQEVAARTGFDPGRSKHRAARVIRHALGLDARGVVEEFAGLISDVKTVPVGDNAKPYEHMSFPAFDPRELIDEEWEDSDLLAHLQHMFIVPLYRESRRIPLMEQRVCRPFVWTPDRDVLPVIRAEWESYRDRVAQGRAEDVLRARTTRYIHVRPKGRDSRDRVPAPGGVMSMRRCFWLNARFVRELILSANSDWRGF